MKDHVLVLNSVFLSKTFWSNSGSAAQIFMWCIVKAVNERFIYSTRSGDIVLEPGQFFTSYRQASKETCISVKKIRIAFDILQEKEEIRLENIIKDGCGKKGHTQLISVPYGAHEEKSLGTLVTVLNYSSYIYCKASLEELDLSRVCSKRAQETSLYSINPSFNLDLLNKLTKNEMGKLRRKGHDMADQDLPSDDRDEKEKLALPPILVEKANRIALMSEHQVSNFLTMYSEDWIEEAIDIALSRKKRSWSYIRGILQGFSRQGGSDSQLAEKAELEELRANGQRTTRDYQKLPWENRTKPRISPDNPFIGLR